MSRKYERKTLRASWSAEDLEEAMRLVRNKTLGVNEASRDFNIPSRTLRRHLITGKPKGPLGRNPVFNQECEKKLVAHIKKLERVGFAPERKDVKEMAFQLAKSLNIQNPFSEDTEAAGNVWFTGFMARNPELSQRKSEGLSLSRAYGVNREDVKEFFDLLAKIYEENEFAKHPEDVFNMDESGIQINNKPGKVVATKGARDVYTLTSCEKGENVTVIACCNAQGNFLPPVLIYKGTYNKPQFSEGLPPGSQVFMNKKSSYINTDLFMKWFEEVFLRHKNSRKTLLILDGHSSHSNNIRLLEVAKENDVILLCLPSHTTHALQPLDRAFFKPLKVYFAQEAKAWMVRCKDKKLTRYDVAKLIGRAWGKAASVSNGVSALKSCGIYPFDPTAIPDHYFALSDSVRNQNIVTDEEHQNLRESPSLLEDNNDRTLIHENDVLFRAGTRCTAASVSSLQRPFEPIEADDTEEQTLRGLGSNQVHEDSAQIQETAITSQEVTSNSLTNHAIESSENYQSDSSNKNCMVTTANVHSSPHRQPTPILGSLLESRFTGVNPSTLWDNDSLNLIEEEVVTAPKPRQIIRNVISTTPQKRQSRFPGVTTSTLCDNNSLNLIEEEFVTAPKPGQITRSYIFKTPEKPNDTINSDFSGNVKSKNTPEKPTPTKVLTAIHPIPKIPFMSSKRKQKAVVLTSTENIEKRKEMFNKKKPKLQAKEKTSTKTKNKQTEEIQSTNISKNQNTENKKSNRDAADKFKKTRKAEKKQPKKRRNKNNEEDSTDMSENELTQDDQVGRKKKRKTVKNMRKPKKSQSKKKKVVDSSSSETVDENEITDLSESELSDTIAENMCIECTEDYYKTQSREDWIPCTVCKGWMHEFCTMYGQMCNFCGRKAKIEAINRAKN